MKPPLCDYSNCKNLGIYKVVFRPNKTIIQMVFLTNDVTSVKNKGYFKIPEDIMLVDCVTNIEYNLISTTNVLLNPEKNYYFNSGIVIKFQLIFKPLNVITNPFDLVSKSKGILIKRINVTP